MLKKLLFGMSLTAVCAVGKAQTVTSAPYEPEFIGETNLLCIAGTDTVVMPLEKSRGRIKSKAGASLYLTGIGSVKTRIHVPGIASSCVAKPNCTYRLIVKAADNKQDPNSFIQLIRFESKKKERRCEIGQINTFKGSSSGIEQLVDYQAKRYGESSYLLAIDPSSGEYGVLQSNPDAKDEKVLMVYCFSIK